MGISEQVQKDMVEAMRKREELRLSTLRMVKAALKNKEIEKRAPLDRETRRAYGIRGIEPIRASKRRRRKESRS